MYALPDIGNENLSSEQRSAKMDGMSQAWRDVSGYLRKKDLLQQANSYVRDELATIFTVVSSKTTFQDIDRAVWFAHNGGAEKLIISIEANHMDGQTWRNKSHVLEYDLRNVVFPWSKESGPKLENC